jgi:TP901 family phage tail tape measure protein
MANSVTIPIIVQNQQALRSVKQVKTAIQGVSQPLGRISGDAAEFSKSLQAAAARVTAFGAIAGVLTGISRGISGAAKATISLNKELIELNSFLGASRSQLTKFGDGLFTIARKTASDFKVVSEAAKEFARQGLSLEETLKRTESALVLSRISGLGFAESVTSITTALNSFNKAALSAETITNKLVAVDVKFAVSAKDLSQAISRVGSSAEEAGINFDQLNAGVTAVQQITGRGGAVIGNSLKTIFTRVQRPEVLRQLQELGVAVRDQNGALLDAITIFQNYGRVRENLNQVEKASTDELLGGVFQINQLKALTRDLTSANSIYTRALSASINATDEATKKNEQLNQSYSASFSQLLTNSTQVGAQLGDNLFGPLFKSAPQTINGILGFISGQDFTGSFGKAGEEAGKSFASSAISIITKSIGDALGAFALPVGSLLAGALAVRLGGFGKTAISSGLKDLVGGFSGIGGKASGYIPAFAKEESRARSLGAINPKAGVIQANIGGKKGPVIVNNQESIFNVRGQTAIIPKYRPLSSIPSFATGNNPSATNPIATQGDLAIGKSVNTAIASSLVLPGILTATSGLARSGKISGNSAEYTNIGAGLLTTILAGITTAMSTKGLSTRARLATAAVATAVPITQTASSAFGLGNLQKSIDVEKLNQQSDKIDQAFSKNVGKIQELTQTLGKLDSAYKDPSTSPNAIVNLNKAISDITRNLAQGSPELAVKLGSAGTPAEKIKIAEDFARKQSTDVGLQKSILSFGGLSDINTAEFQKLFTEFTSSIAGDAFKNLSVENLKGQSTEEFANTLSESLDLKPVLDFFSSQGENSGKLLGSYKEFLTNQVEIAKITDSATEQVVAATEGVSNIIRQIRGQKEINLARSTAFSKGVSSLGSNLGSLGGGRLGGLAFAADKGISDVRIQQERNKLSATAVFASSDKTSDDLKALNDAIKTAGREIEKQTGIANQTLQVQKEISNEIAKATSFAGGIGSTTSAGTRNESFQELLRPFIKARLGAQFGSARTAASGKAEFLAALAQQFPGSGVGSSIEAESARRNLQGFRAADIRRSAFQATGLARGLGMGGAGFGVLSNARGAETIARDQVEQLLPTGRTPSIARRLLARNEAESLSARRTDRALNTAQKTFEDKETKTRAAALEKPIGEIAKLGEAVKEGLESSLKGLKIDSATINVTNLSPSNGANKSGGFIPSFANPLRAAINREKQLVPSSTIRVNQSNKLSNRMNPMGLAVTNTIDEPNGLASIGLASGGFIPNFGGRAFNDRHLEGVVKKLKNNLLFVQNGETGKTHRILSDGNFSRRPIDPSSIKPNSQIITFKNSRDFNQLFKGQSLTGRFPYPSDKNLSRLGSALKRLGPSNFDRMMTGSSNQAKIFNRAEETLSQTLRKTLNFGSKRGSMGDMRVARMNYLMALNNNRLQAAAGYAADIARFESQSGPGLSPAKDPFSYKQPKTPIVKNAFPGANYKPPTGPSLMRLRESLNFSRPVSEATLARRARIEFLVEAQRDRRRFQALQQQFSGPSTAARRFGSTFSLKDNPFDILKREGSQISGKVSQAVGGFRNIGSRGLNFMKAAGGFAFSKMLPVATAGVDVMDVYKGQRTGSMSGLGESAGTLLGFGGDIALMRLGIPGLILGTTSASLRAGGILGEFTEIDDNIAFDYATSRSGIEEGNAMTEGLQGILKMKQARRKRRGEERSPESIAARIKQIKAKSRGRSRDGKVRRGKRGIASLVRPAALSPRERLKNHIEDLGYTSAQAEHYLPFVMRRMQFMRSRSNFSSGFIPNFAGGIGAEMMDIATSPDYSGFRNAVPEMSNFYPNIVKNSAEIEVPAADVYSRMGFPGAKPKNPAEQYAILNPAQQSSLGYAADGFVPNFASDEFVATMVAALEKVFSPMVNKMSSTESTSNVINVNDQRTFETTPEKVDGVMEFLAQQFPKEIGKLGLKI